MKNKVIKHILIRLGFSIILLFLLHLSQIEYSIDPNLIGIGFKDNPALIIGSLILFAWILYLIFEIIRLFKNKLKWLAIANMVLIVLILLSYSFINILLAVSRC